MIRIDEIYYNVFAAAFKDQPDTGLHWFDPFGSTSIDDLCNVPPVHGIANKRIIFWDQEPTYRENLRKFFDEFVQTYQSQKTIIITSEKNSEDINWAKDQYQLLDDYYFFHGWAALEWYRGYNHSYLSQPWNERDFQHTFMCLNNIIGGNRRHRLELLHHLHQRDLIKNNLVSCPEKCPYESTSAIELLQDAGFSTDIDLPLVIDRHHNHAHSSHRLDLWPQSMRVFLQVVTETVYVSSRLHLTEKTFKPIVLQQPFILVAPQGSLGYLREYGFKTFNDLWDESYDFLPDDQRINAVANLLHDIDSWSPARMKQAQHDAWPIIRHNHNWFYNDFQNILWKELSQMVDRWR